MTKPYYGIKTTYKGIEFRSRLEATWAAFFDLLDWKWEYEPIDLPGWIPDFALYGTHGTVLVEVKPIVNPDRNVLEKIFSAMERSRDMSVAVLVGQTVGLDGRVNGNDSVSFGWEVDRGCCTGVLSSWDNGDLRDGDAVQFVKRWDNGNYDFCSEHGSWRHRLGDGYQECDDDLKDDIEKKWATAKNKTQWKGGR